MERRDPRPRNRAVAFLGGSRQTEIMATTELHDAVREWFTRFGDCCAAVDYETAVSLFADDVVAFGTRMDIVAGLESLVVHQWKQIWPNIREFRFDLKSLRTGGDEGLAWGVCLWNSIGSAEDGGSFARPGRATVILEHREGRWIATHTHFSLFPGTPSRT